MGLVDLMDDYERDPLLVSGLRAAAKRGEDWRVRIRRPQFDSPHLDEIIAARTPDATLGQVVVVFGEDVIPERRASVETVYRARQLARVVCDVAGNWSADEAEARLAELRALLRAPRTPGGRPRMSAERTSRAISMVWRALNTRRWLIGRPQLPKLTPAEPTRPRPPRRTLPLLLCAELLWHARPRERVRLALALGAGLWPGEIERLRGCDLVAYTTTADDADRVRVPEGTAVHFVRVGARRGRRGCRWIPLPPWVTALIGRIELGRGGEPLVQGVPGLAQTMRRLREEVEGAEDVTAMSLVRTWQGIAVEMERTREVVRGSWRQPSKGERAWPTRWHRAQRQLWNLAVSWMELDWKLLRPLVEGTRTVARRAPSACPPAFPERSRRRRRAPAPMPALAAVRGRDGEYQRPVLQRDILVPKQGGGVHDRWDRATI